MKTAYKEMMKMIKFCQHQRTARNKFLAYVDFANADSFPDKPYEKQVFQSLTEKLLRRQNLDRISRHPR